MPDGLPIGYRRLADGVTRPVFRELDGREFVINGDGKSRSWGVDLSRPRQGRTAGYHPGADRMNNATRERCVKIPGGTGNVLAIVVLVLLAIDPTRNLYPIFCMLIPAVVLEVVSYRIGRPK